ncbi:ABC-type polysaccharide/polyol phosphate transport system, ATPase component [Mucilaginibacter xinganensis]|uniref:ABC-type polysaccharide/polyol phosphate transport system, ATPase component n=1 Tax=Mucilaginibacter xinganensis TaxID=1234841 RepID=A0A223P3Z6_9SPHI|nr:ABC-type polysaccharide/polyol phosphate transport system, ATPase component [Mucilaginibacter xinganensis]
MSKAYQLGEIGTGTLSRDLERSWARLRGKEDPFLKIGEVNDRTVKGTSNIVWSLKNLNFDIQQGDAVGIIGRNGAGKSTLLKILSRVTAPTTGSVKVKGRIASLLEVGTGFHPELSGRENIYLNGAILGMRKAEIKRKFDEIVDFSGVERYIDTPVKRYSSGMYVRLAFAVAAHLESEIMIVDEVLAVGDAEFQKKCLGKMGDVSQGEGRTVLFVSHNMQAIQKLCRNTIFLHQGEIDSIGTPENIITKYLQRSQIKKAVFDIPKPDDNGDNIGYATKLQIEDINNNIVQEIPVGSPWQIRVFFKINKRAQHFIAGLGINSATDINIRTSWSTVSDLAEGCYEVVFKENHLILTPGTYNLILGLSNYERTVHYVENVAMLTISPTADLALDDTIIRLNNVGFIVNPMSINISPVEDF